MKPRLFSTFGSTQHLLAKAQTALRSCPEIASAPPQLNSMEALGAFLRDLSEKAQKLTSTALDYRTANAERIKDARDFVSVAAQVAKKVAVERHHSEPPAPTELRKDLANILAAEMELKSRLTPRATHEEKAKLIGDIQKLDPENPIARKYKLDLDFNSIPDLPQPRMK